MNFDLRSQRAAPDSLSSPGGLSAQSDYFFFNLARSSLVPAEEAREAVADAAEASGDEGVERWQRKWIAAGRLTPWQVDALSKGRRSFIYNRYKIIDYIGRGGMGSVFKGVDLKTGKFVALKFISEEFSSKTHALARFSREVELMLKLDHPNIVRAFFADLEGAEPYFAMEFVAGETLRSYIDSVGVLPVDFACELIAQSAMGMQYAHEHGVVHRDLKPTNIMVAWAPSGGGPIAKVLDLGLTRLADSSGEQRDVGLTATGQCIGTPEYIAPEQAFNSKIADGRSDVFSLACTLFHMLTNQLPYTGRSALEQVLARADRVALRLDAYRHDLPEGLADVVAKALERDPNKRVSSLGEFSSLLSQFSPGPAALAPMQHQLRVEASTPSEGDKTMYREPTPAPNDAPTVDQQSDPGDKIVARLRSLVRPDEETPSP